MKPENITRESAQQRSRIIAVASYQVTVDLSGLGLDGQSLENPTGTFISTSEVRFHSTGEATHIDLIADEVLDVTLDEEMLEPGRYADCRFLIDADEGDHVLTITALCRYSHTGEGLHRFVDPADHRVYLCSQFETADARRMYANFEQPDLKASFQLNVIAPSDWTVISNSPAVQPVEVANGNSAWEFAPTPPISTYITALIAGHYHVAPGTIRSVKGEIPASLLCRRSVLEHLDEDRIRRTTQRGFDVFEKHFDRPYPFDSYDQAFVPEFNAGAMENAGCVTIRDEYLFRSRVTEAAYESRDNTILHELAHMWFGDLVTMTWWDDLWLNESFAEWASHFAQAKIAEDDGGRDPWASFTNARKNWAYMQDQLPTTHPVAADMVDLEAVEENFDGITYAKGASVLKQLVSFVGEEEFLAGVGAYFTEHAWGNTQLNDLLTALETSSGRDLSGFSAEWLEKSGVNTIRADFDTDDQGRLTRFDVVQTAPELYPTLRTHRIAIGRYQLGNDSAGAVLECRDSLEVDIVGERTPIAALIGQQRPDLLLLNDRDLSYAKVRLDERSLDTLIGHIHQLSDPVARAVCWGAAWDMCRDAEMSAADYIELALRGVATEEDPTAVGSLRSQAATAALAYTPADLRQQRRVRTAARFAGLLRDAEPGSDHQLSFANSVIQLSASAAGAALLHSWLDGSEAPAGLQVDTDMRWRILLALARMGNLDVAAIDAEQQHDNTISGAEAAAGVRAALLDVDAKQQAWQRATGDPDVPNGTHRSICGAFFLYGQEAVLAPYAERYLEVVQQISDRSGDWAARGHVAAQTVLFQLFPRQFADRDYLDRLEAWMSERELSEQVAKSLIEQRDQAERALRVQQVSR